MKTSYFRFYEELNDFLPAAKRKQTFSCAFRGNPSVKDIIESLGVPHVEVDLILVNRNPVDFSYKLMDEDRISVYPVFESLDISGVTHLRAKPLRILRFIADAHLGRLARYLRLCGFDTFYEKDITDERIIKISGSEKRIILTRDKILLKNNLVTHGYWVRSEDPLKQFREIRLRLDLNKSFDPFSRCLECNSLLEDISKEEVAETLLPKTKQYYDIFKKCPGCNRVYWNGSHFENMKKQLDILRLQ